MLSRLPAVRILLADLYPLVSREGENAADNRERKLQVQVNCERADVSEAIPNCSANSEVYWLYFDGKPQAVESVELMKIGVNDAQGSRNGMLARMEI